jgi:hypothetical protein
VLANDGPARDVEDGSPVAHMPVSIQATGATVYCRFV